METVQKKISMLINAEFYFLQWVFIVKEKDNYFRLIAIHNNRIILDQNYQTLRGAKISCTKTIQARGFNMNLKSQWSPLYVPESDWLIDKLKKSVQLQSFGKY